MMNILSCSVMTSKREKKQFADSKKHTQILALKNQENEEHHKKNRRSKKEHCFTENHKRVKKHIQQLFILYARTSCFNSSESLWWILIVHEIWFDSWWTVNRMTIDSLWYRYRRIYDFHLSNCNSRNQSNECRTANLMMYDIHWKIFENDSILNRWQFTWFRYDRKHWKNSKSRIKERNKAIQQRATWKLESKYWILEEIREIRRIASRYSKVVIFNQQRNENENCRCSSWCEIIFYHLINQQKWNKRKKESEVFENITSKMWESVLRQMLYSQDVVCVKNWSPAVLNFSEKTQRKIHKEWFSRCA